MQIQRWQSVWLLCATVLMVIFCFSPMFFIPGATEAEGRFLNPVDMPVFLTVTSVIALLLFLSIFLYRNTRQQKRLTIVSMLLIVVCCVTEGFVYFGWGTIKAEMEWQGSIFLLLGALLFAMMAYRGITHDEKLLKAADRLR